jgi:hypothetical protein
LCERLFENAENLILRSRFVRNGVSKGEVFKEKSFDPSRRRHRATQTRVNALMARRKTRVNALLAPPQDEDFSTSL